MLTAQTITDAPCNSFVEDPEQVVMDEELQDPVIKHTYKNLPWVGLVPLRSLIWLTHLSIHRTAILTAFKDDPNGPDLVWFSMWKPILRPYNEEYVLTV
jgi:hypothetical protein